MAAPSLQAEAAALTVVTSGACAPTIPTHAADDILVATVLVWVPNTAGTIYDIPTPSGWNKIGSVDLNGATKDGQFAWFWRRAAASGETVSFARGTTAPGTTAWDTGTDGAYAARVDVIRGCETTGNPFDDAVVSANFTAANQNTPAVTVSGSERTVMFFEVYSTDTTTAQFTARTNFTMGTNRGSTTGTGGGARNARRENVSSSESATATTHTASTSPRSYAFCGISFKPFAIKQTPVAEISLASHGEPSERTNHSIKIRARTTSGSTGVIKAALYEGANNRSGDLTSGALTNSLADYTLVIPDASAANITDYSNLSLRIWGYDATGHPLVFEVADVYLELPEGTGPATLYGATAMAVTFSKAVAGFKSTKTAVAEISLASHGTPTERTNHTIEIRARTTTGSTGVIRAALYEGANNRSGDLSSGVLSNALADYSLVIPDASAANITDYSNLSLRIWGFDTAGNALVFEVANVYLKLPTGGATTYYGVTATPLTFVKAVQGTKKTFGVTATPLTFTKAVQGTKKTFGVTATPLTFVKAVQATRKTFGQLVAPFTFIKAVAAKRTYVRTSCRSFHVY